MPIFFQQEIDKDTRFAIWKIEEAEPFFNVPLQRHITHPHKRLQHLAGRYLLKHLFSDFPLELIKVADTRKPYLEDEAFHFSISHCGDYAAAIVSRNKRVGVDIEIPTPKVEKIKHKFLHPEELAWLNGEPSMVKGKCSKPQEESNKPEEKIGGAKPKPQTANFQTSTAELTLLWSAKEAVFKWWSYGAVDFSEMIRIDDYPSQEEGEIRTRFLAPETSYSLVLHYHFFDSLCLAWVTD